MKTFNQFQQDLQEAIPLAAPFILPAAAAALGAAGMIYQARKKQPPPQPSPDYGQGGETAKPRKPAVQRPSEKTPAAKTYDQVIRDRRRAEAQARREDEAKQGIERLLGSDADRAAAARAREQNRIRSRQQSTRRRMGQAGQNIPPEHRAD